MADESQTTARQGLSAQGVENGLSHLLDQGWHGLRRAAAHYQHHQHDDPEALHDLRVAMRRLRSLYQAFAPAFNPHDPRPSALRTLFRQTNTQRDLEVALALLRSLPERLPWLEATWQQRLVDENRALHDLPKAIHDGDAHPNTPLCHTHYPSLGALAARRLRTQGKRFHRQVKRLSKDWDDNEAHQLRIRIKKLRYLLEPFARQHRPCASTIKPVKELQEQLGDFRDLQLLRASLRQLQRQQTDPARQQELRLASRELKQREHQARRGLRQIFSRQTTALLKRLRKAIDSLST